LDKTATSSTVDITLSPNFTYFLGNRWSANLGWGALGYNSQTDKNEATGNKTTTGAFKFDVDLTAINWGITFWIK
ncbi:hypothetical protein OAH12_02285, partial [Cyclobacteriaceae bacterium]|nr:hypothetical protein [Cyclobacteriaceae bacterium]